MSANTNTSESRPSSLLLYPEILPGDSPPNQPRKLPDGHSLHIVQMQILRQPYQVTPLRPPQYLNTKQ